MSSFPAADVHVVRDLARKATELASSEEYEARRRRWRDANERRRPDRAPVWCRPARVWQEILPAESLACSDPHCRSVEYTLRQHLYKDWIGDDHIFEPWWGVGAHWDCDTEYTWGLRTGYLAESTEVGGFRYDPPVKTPEDYELVSVPTFTYNLESTQRALSHMAELLGDAMPVRLVCGPPLGAHQNVVLQQLRGMAAMLDDLAFRPELIHRTMAKLTEGVLRALRTAEDTGMLTANHHAPMFCSDPVNGTRADGTVRLCNLWEAANSQEFQNVSPAMQEESLLNYQIPVLEQFGATQYGCCEDLTRKIDIVMRIPNLRVFVCSPWTNLDKLIEACGTRYTIMWRQSAAAVTFAGDMGPIREHLAQGMSKLQGHYYQVVLREVETLHGRPDRIKDWARTAIEVAEQYA